MSKPMLDKLATAQIKLRTAQNIVYIDRVTRKPDKHGEMLLIAWDAERLPATQIVASKKMTRDTHSMANALPSTGCHPETAFLIQQKLLPPQNKMLVPHCGYRSGTPMVNDQLSGVTEGSSQMNTWPAAQMSPGPLGGV